MDMRALLTRAPAVFIANALLCSAAPPAATQGNLDIGKLARSQVVFVGTLEEVRYGPVGMSMPPLYTSTLTFNIKQVLRGDLAQGASVELSHSARQKNKPLFPKGKLCLVSGAQARGRLVAATVTEATDELVASVRKACSLPLGWTTKGEEIVSPWAKLGEKAWPSSRPATEGVLRCSVTGRPAFLLGNAVSLAVEKVPPAKDIKWTNPDGDGEYRITLTNTSKEPVSVPGLPTVDGKPQWAESLVIICQGRVYPIPGAKGIQSQPSPTSLKPGASISTVVNALSLQGPEWPRGGYRIEFQFCLGEKSQTKSFYYMSRHHDKLRDAAQRAAGK